MAKTRSLSAKEYLRSQLREEYRKYFGVPERDFLGDVVDAWMNDAENSKHRFDVIETYLPGARRVLDMASGCGTAVFYGLLNGYDVEGIDPEPWKYTFNTLKAEEYGYPDSWIEKLALGKGESLPYADNSFDCTTSYQTLEHVQDLFRVVSEMVRVTRVGGGIHIRCPDFRSTFEGHYRLPWLPLFPRPLARTFLRVLGRPTKGLGTLNYTTPARISGLLRRLEGETPGLTLEIIDVNQDLFEESLRRFSLPLLPGTYAAYRVLEYLWKLFREEMHVNLFVRIVAKAEGDVDPVTSRDA